MGPRIFIAPRWLASIGSTLALFLLLLVYCDAFQWLPNELFTESRLQCKNILFFLQIRSDAKLKHVPTL